MNGDESFLEKWTRVIKAEPPPDPLTELSRLGQHIDSPESNGMDDFAAGIGRAVAMIPEPCPSCGALPCDQTITAPSPAIQDMEALVASLRNPDLAYVTAPRAAEAIQSLTQRVADLEQENAKLCRAIAESCDEMRGHEFGERGCCRAESAEQRLATVEKELAEADQVIAYELSTRSGDTDRHPQHPKIIEAALSRYSARRSTLRSPVTTDTDHTERGE